MTQSRNAVSNLVARYKAVLKNCHLLNVMAAAALAGAVVLGSAGMAVAEDAPVANAVQGEDGIIRFDTAGELSSQGDVDYPIVSTNVPNGNFTITAEDTDVTMDGQFTLHDKTTISGDGELFVKGYLTQTAEGSNVDVTATVLANAEGNGGLVLGNDLTVADFALKDGTDIALWVGDAAQAAKNLIITESLEFAGNNEIRVLDKTEDGDLPVTAGDLYLHNGGAEQGRIEVLGELTVNGQLSLNDAFLITNEDDDKEDAVTTDSKLIVNGALTQTAAGSQILVDTVINAVEYKDGEDTKHYGYLVLGNDLEVGNMTFGENADLVLFGNEETVVESPYGKVDGKILNIAKGKTLTFTGDNEIRYSNPAADAAAVLLMGEGDIVSEGTLTVKTNPVLMTTMKAENIAIAEGGDLTIGQCDEVAPRGAGNLTAKNIDIADGGEMNVDYGTATVDTISNKGDLNVDGTWDYNEETKEETYVPGILTATTINSGVAAVEAVGTEGEDGYKAEVAAVEGKINVNGGELIVDTLNNIAGTVSVGDWDASYAGDDYDSILVVDKLENNGTVEINNGGKIIFKNGFVASAEDTGTYDLNGGEAIFLGDGLDLSALKAATLGTADADGNINVTLGVNSKITTTTVTLPDGVNDIAYVGEEVLILGNGSDGAFINNSGDLAIGDGTAESTLCLGTGFTGEGAQKYTPEYASYNQGGTFAGDVTVAANSDLDVDAGNWTLGGLTVAGEATVEKDATLTVSSINTTGTTTVNGTLGIDMTGAVNAVVAADATKEIEAVEETFGIKGSVDFAEGSTLLVSGAVIDKGVEFDEDGKLKDAADNIIGTLIENTTDLADATIETDNQLLEIKYDATKGLIATAVAATEALPNIDPDLAKALGSYDEGDNAFLKKSLAMDKEAASKAVESAAKVGAAAGVGGAIGNVGAAGAANIQVRTGSSSATAFNEFDTSNMLAMSGDGAILPVANTQEGFGIWFMPMYKHTSADGFKSGNSSFGYDTDLYGATLGADYTFASSLRLGLAFNVGTGETDSTGDFADTNTDFDYVGLSAYGSMSFGHLALSADIGYTSSNNDVHQKNGGASLNADIDAALISAGVKAEYQIALNSLNITPYAGIRVNYYDIDSFDVAGIQHTDSSDYTVVEFPIGLTFDTTLNAGDWDITPSLGLGVKFAAGDLDPEQEVRFNGLDESSVLSSEVADEVTFQGALGLGFAKDAYSINLGYTLDLSENVESHGINLNLRYEF